MLATTPAEDLIFGLTQVIDLPGLTAAGGAPLGAADIAAIIGEAERFAHALLAPHAMAADRHGARFENGVVRTPDSYKPAYRAWIEGGWQGLSAHATVGGLATGGQDLPQALGMAVSELITSGDMAFALCPLLTKGAIEALARFASPAQQAAWLPELVSGAWTGTMCLTESQAGSDLSQVRTKAEPVNDARALPGEAAGYRITGQKIYITYGEHDLTANTLHLILARLPDAPPGTRGISLFAAPKILPDGTRNALRCGGTERKLGIHASPTCTMLFEGAAAALVGEPHRGLPAMFAMMNSARLDVGVQGVAQGARALALAEAFAAQRIQGGGLSIDRHPDVARMLAEMRAIVLAGRLLALEAGAALDRARFLGDAGAEARVALLTPIVKAWCTDRGVDCANLGIQVHGGMGFVEDTGAAQVLRDARIAPIYEGTNGIQAMDLVGRKLFRDGGALMLGLIGEVRAADRRLAGAATALERATRWLLAHGQADAAAAEAGAAAYLDACGWTLGGWMLARAGAADPRYAPLAAFYLARLLPRAAARVAEIEAPETLLALLPAA